jgi:D-alanyl-D-alanine carboxypeptidase
MRKHFQNKKQTYQILYIISFILLTFSKSLTAQIDTALASQLQQILINHVLINGDHGVSACVIMPNGDTWKGTAGVGAGNVAISDTTVFHGASITKTNIATLLLLLAEDGLINLDSSWHHYVNLNVNFDTNITVRQLINHTSGIADYLEVAGSGHHVTNDYNHAFTPVEILENIVSGVPDFPAGTNFNYSTSNFVLAALIAETVTGNPVQQELRTRIWGPLGMTHTYFGGFENYTEPRSGVWWDFESGFQDYSSVPETSMLTYAYGGGNIVSTPEDLAHFARALFTGNILTSSSMNEMTQFVPYSYAAWSRGYGLGIHHAYNFSNDSLLGHDGYYSNMADMFHSYDYGFTLVTMTNTETQWFAIFDQMYNAIKNYIQVGITDQPGSHFIQIFPNPVKDHLSIVAGNENKSVELTIADLNGKIFYTATLPESQHIELNTSNFVSGVYFLKIKTVKTIEMKKLIVVK